jgi:hypothetical protein
VDVSEDDKRDAIAAVFEALELGQQAPTFGACGQQAGNEAADA